MSGVASEEESCSKSENITQQSQQAFGGERRITLLEREEILVDLKPAVIAAIARELTEVHFEWQQKIESLIRENRREIENRILEFAKLCANERVRTLGTLLPLNGES